MKKAVILLSGGLDSATVLALAKQANYNCYALSFNYGQRHAHELQAAKTIANIAKVQQHLILPMDLRAFGGSALTDNNIAVPPAGSTGIPATYVPARNTIFLSLALGWAEILGTGDIFIGVNAIDYSGYPDCRPAFIHAFENMANLATKAAIEGLKITIHTPLLHLSKAEIIQQGIQLGVDYALTTSCYNPDSSGRACRVCDACHLRKLGFIEANITDPTLYTN